MDDLVEWLRAQVDADERAAPRVHSEDCALHAWLRSDVPSACDCGWPARVLRDVEAKRRLLDYWPDPFGKWSAPEAEAAKAMKDRTLRLLALPYDDRPGYREEWRP